MCEQHYEDVGEVVLSEEQHNEIGREAADICNANKRAGGNRVIPLDAVAGLLQAWSGTINELTEKYSESSDPEFRTFVKGQSDMAIKAHLALCLLVTVDSERV
jgi:hypothetical protein